ncbi:MAG: FHA domain-containing protein [Gammaproteobacteria bacterium]|nr:FHA domain-containing protein [Gammaproteobacteria bacterium]
MGASVTLKAIEGSLSGKRFLFTESSACRIGRAKDCEIPIPSDDHEQFVSRYHCVLDIDPPSIRIQDLQSKNGTFVNSRKLGKDPVRLQHGDKIKLGRTVLQVEIAKLPDAVPATQMFQDPAEMATQLFTKDAPPNLETKSGREHSRQSRRSHRPTHGSDLSPLASFNVSYFGFRRKPFQGSGLDFLRAYPDYEASYARLLDSIRLSKGLILLIGDSGTGKSLLLGNIVYDPTVGLNSVLCKAPLGYDELLTTICENLELAVAGSERPHKLQALMEYMNAPNRESIVLIIDDADKMDNSTMRSTVSLSRLGIVGSIVMSGTSVLKRQVSKLHGETQDSDAKQENRILTNATYIELKPLSTPQAAAFIHQQLQVAGGRGDTLFLPAAVDRIAVVSNGIPRAINALCDRALLLTEQAGRDSVSVSIVNDAADQLQLINNGKSADSQVSAPTFTMFEGGRGPAPAQEQGDPIVIRGAPSSPNGQPQSGSKGWVLVLIGLLLLLMVGGIGAFLIMGEGESLFSPAATPSGTVNDHEATQSTPTPSAQRGAQ